MGRPMCRSGEDWLRSRVRGVSPRRRSGVRKADGTVNRAAAAILRLLAGFCVLSAGCVDPSPQSTARRPTEREADQVLRDIVLRETTDGALEWVLRARSAYRNEGSEETRLDSLRVDFYQGAPEVRSVLTSDSGRVDAKKGILVAVGNVVVVTREGNRLETEKLVWNRITSRVRSDTLVRMTRGSDVLTGIGFESDPDLTTYSLQRDVRASVRDDGALQRAWEGSTGGDADR